MKKLVGKPVLIDALDAELVPKVVEAIIDDNERAKQAKQAKKAKKDDDKKGKQSRGVAEAEPRSGR